MRVVLTDVLDLATPIGHRRQKEEHINALDDLKTRRLTEEEQQRGLDALVEFDAFEEAQDTQMAPDSTESIRQMREKRTGELISRLEE